MHTFCLSKRIIRQLKKCQYTWYHKKQSITETKHSASLNHALYMCVCIKLALIFCVNAITILKNPYFITLQVCVPNKK
jgi:hypothetical protein